MKKKSARANIVTLFIFKMYCWERGRQNIATFIRTVTSGDKENYSFEIVLDNVNRQHDKSMLKFSKNIS